MQPGRRWLVRVSELAAALALTAALSEAGLRALVSLGWLRIPAPAREESSFWDGDHPLFGVWHRPLAREQHTRECFSVSYRANSVGARDVERAPGARGFRVVVLGDSFVEGWGVESEDRLTERLERETGFEHLNLGMSHFGPYQQVLAYRELGQRFEHDAVIATVLPVNDFSDLDLELSRGEEWYEYRHRPYLVRENGGFRHVDHREPGLARWLRHHTYVWNAFRTLRALARVPGQAREKARVRSRFWDFSDEQFALLEHALELLADEVGDRKLAVVLIPSRRDLHWYGELGPDRLAERLRPFAERRGARVIDLLPAMYAHTRPWKRYFLDCDHHWSAYGNQVAAELLLRALRDDFYPARPT